jgi:hypothetical protein
MDVTVETKGGPARMNVVGENAVVSTPSLVRNMERIERPIRQKSNGRSPGEIECSRE